MTVLESGMSKVSRIGSMCLLTLGILAASCSPRQPVATVEPVTSTPTASSTPQPTLAPTVTPSLTPTPDPFRAVGDLLQSDNWEATVVQAAYRKTIKMVETIYTPKPGYMAFDVIVKVKHLNPASDPVTNVENDLVVDEHGKSWLATCWGAHDVAKSQGKDLSTLTVIGCQTGNIYTMKIDSESYVRFIFLISDTSLGKPIYFTFEDLPPVRFVIDKTQ